MVGPALAAWTRSVVVTESWERPSLRGDVGITVPAEGHGNCRPLRGDMGIGDHHETVDLRSCRAGCDRVDGRRVLLLRGPVQRLSDGVLPAHRLLHRLQGRA